ncbi:hypothetical protein DUNSADRAFT_1143 [Dunaliella salina]|uniref:Uncharacterized protein n=1 Tax=Dunaliella salina TaxID=3046 RepID=A0ABQ7FXX5_DUNSA|nr:hypothetical protein DUNSADRAFT_1143 [Dunaliella salina]|eukprot:KAF5827204.1 hypothetical protein DUNSADRAFT_1143 [Dunaliella salina]
MQPEDLEMWASHAKPQASALPNHLGMPITGPQALMDREIENAEDLEELCAVVLRHHDAPGLPQEHQYQYAPRTLSLALLRLTDWETDSSPAAGRSFEAEGLGMPNAHNQARVLEVLQSRVVAACMDSASSNQGEVAAVGASPGFQPAIDSSLMANYLWSLATLHGADSLGAGDGGKAAGLQQVCTAVEHWAKHGLALPETVKVEATSTPDLTSILWGYAALLQMASHTDEAEPSSSSGSTPISEAGSALVDALAAEMAARMLHSARGRGLQPADLADLAWALNACGRRSPQVTSLAEAVAAEVFFQISDRHSLKAPFTAPEVIKVVMALSQLGIKTKPIGAALDAVAGHVVKRLRIRHVSAIDKPDDILALLTAYADAEHSSVMCREQPLADSGSWAFDPSTRPWAAHLISSNSNSHVVPELVAATAGQLISDIAHHHHWVCTSGDDVPEAWTCRYWQSHLHSRTIAGLLRAYVRLNMYPGKILLASLAIALQPQLQATQTEHLKSLTQDLDALGHTVDTDKLQHALQEEIARRATA